jgi:tetratricopeptide (TPR) repeat protein
VLGFRGEHPEGHARHLLDALVAHEGEAAVFRATTTRAEAPVREAPTRGDWIDRVPSGGLATLRAASIIGATFEVELVGELLGRSTLEVLLDLQAAADAGAPVIDRGDGVLTMSDEAVERLRAGMLPSLRSAWHAQVARLLSSASSEAARPAAEAAPTPEPPAERAPTPASTSVTAEQAPTEASADATTTRWSDDAPSFDVPSVAAGDEAGDAGAAEPAEATHTGETAAQTPAAGVATTSDEGQGEAARPPREAAAAREPDRELGAQASASGMGAAPARARIHRGPQAAAPASDQHFAAGELELGITRLLDAADHAAGLGAHQQAHGYATRALGALRQLPSSPGRRRLEVRALASLGRIRLTGVGHPRGPRFDLEAALEPLEAAKKLLGPGDPPEAWVEVARLHATACYEQGDLPALERGLATLVEASQALMAQGASHHAARLLNEQAAITIRMGDPVRAMSLLTESRRLFEDRAREDAVARLEMAETDHLIATIPLVVRAKPGREDDALLAALDHAKAAERVYRELGRPVDAARVRETMGRLELTRGREERAGEHLQAALAIQDAHGDVVGLARTSAAIASLLARRGRHAEAIAELIQSTRLYRRKGSALGVAENRRAIERIAASLPRNQQNLALVERAAAELDAAEAELGRIHLPGEADA